MMRPNTEPTKPSSVENVAPARRELEMLLDGDLPRDFTRTLRRLLAHPIFRRREGLTASQAGELAYLRAGFLARAVGLRADELARDPRRLYVLHEWVGLADGVACTVLGIHYCLALGSILAHGEGRPELEPFVRELERVESFGVFLATELGFGNNVGSLETEAVYQPETREFVLSSPTPRSFKFMPNTAHAVPKLAVVMARLIVEGENRGVFPFIVRLRDASGAPVPGVRIAALSEKPGYVLDNAVTRFDAVRVPKEQLLAGSDSVLHDDGRFESRIASRHRRFLHAMDRVQTGRVCFTSTVVSSLRAASWIAGRYTAQRLTFAPGKRTVPLLEYLNVQRDVFGALASAYAFTFAVQHVQRHFRERTTDTEAESFRLVATLKAVATSEVADALARLRERCGAAGMFSQNRILEYFNQAQGVITAEGDNQLMLLKVGAQLCRDAPRVVERVTWNEPTAPSPERCLELLRYREARLHAELRAHAATQRAARDPFLAWNRSVNAVMALATAHGERIVAERFFAVLGETQHSENRRVLGTLCSLWCLARIEREAGWYLAEGCLTNRSVKELSGVRDRLCSELEPHATALIEAFGMDNTLLQAPIAEDDYVRAHASQAGAFALG